MMRESRWLLLMVGVTCLTMAGVLFSGCGSGGTARIDNPMEFFLSTRENMKNAASFRMEGEMLMQFRGIPGMEAVPGMETMAVAYNMACELDEGGELLARMVMSVEEPFGLDTEMYILGGRMYMEMPGGVWVYEDMGLPAGIADMSRSMGPQYMMDILDMAESAEVVAEDGESITYSLILDYAKVMEEADMEMMEEMFAREGMPADSFPAFMAMLGEMYAASDFEVTADKDSGVITRYSMRMEMDLHAMAQFIADGELPPGACVIVDGDFRVGEYGKSFGIRLPDEAKGAVPLRELQERLQA